MPHLLGHHDGLKKKDIRQLEKLGQRAVPADQFVSATLAEELCLLALQIDQPLTLLVDRQGRVWQVFVGSITALGEEHAVTIPQKAMGTCGLRAITVQLEQMNPPSKAALTTLIQYRLDALVTLAASNRPTWSARFGEHPKACDAAFISHLSVSHPQDNVLNVATEGPITLHTLDRRSFPDFMDLVETALNGWRGHLKHVQQQEQAFLVALAESGVQGRSRAEDLLDELAMLTRTAGAQVVGQAIQSRSQPDPVYYLGKGRAHELAFEIQQLGADLVITDDELSTVQQRTLERILRTRVIDRTELILDIFAQRAQSWEGKIQVELAQLQYLLPRLTGKGLSLSQQTATAKGGTIATRGPGETKLELDRRRMRTRIAELERQAESVRRHRRLQRKARLKNDIPIVALVGYTNAGKSTLLNTLTKAGALAEDKLFATLDPLTRRLVRPGLPPCLLVDTVGFIQKLPTTLVKAFRSTLEEVQAADIIWHIVDLSHPDRLNQMQAVQETLADLECDTKPQWVLLNKVDRVKLPQAELESLASVLDGVPCFPVSATTGEGLDTLLEALGVALNQFELYLEGPETIEYEPHG